MKAREIVVISALLLSFGGCGSSGESQTYDMATSRLSWLLKLRNQAMSRGNMPQSEADFKAYINGLDAETRDRLFEGADVSSVDELFVSERDGQPFVIFYGQPPAGVAPDLVAFEQTGVDGKRYVGYGVGRVEEVDEQRFNEVVPPAARPKQ